MHSQVGSGQSAVDSHGRSAGERSEHLIQHNTMRRRRTRLQEYHASNLYNRRRRVGLSRKEFALELGLANDTVAQYETGAKVMSTLIFHRMIGVVEAHERIELVRLLSIHGPPAEWA